MNRMVAMLLVALGTTTVVEVIDLVVRIEKSWAFATYGIAMKGETMTPPYRQKISTETLVDSGYNEEDLLPNYNN